MGWQNRTGKATTDSLYDELRVESIVFAYVTTERPSGIRIAALAEHFNEELGQGVEGDAVERAVVELVRNRLLMMEDGLVKPGPLDLPDPVRS
jgi:hypothetical protein